MKKIILIISALLLVLSFAGCSAETKTLTCDSCGKEVSVDKDSNMDEDWIVFCEECEAEIGAGEIIE